MKARETAETLRVRSFQGQNGEPNEPQRRYPKPSIIPVTIPACWTAPDRNDNLPPTTPTSALDTWPARLASQSPGEGNSRSSRNTNQSPPAAAAAGLHIPGEVTLPLGG